jgi:hypothetical protein
MTNPAMILALALLLAGCEVSDDNVDPGSTSPASEVTYRNPSGTWEISHPERFDRGTFPELPGAPRFTYEGIWITNFGSPDFDQGPIPSQIPNDGVLIEVFQTFGGAFFIPSDPDSHFPISYDDLKVQRGLYEGEWLTKSVITNGDSYTIEARIGIDASDKDRQAAADIVSSLRFLPLQTGSTTGRQLTYYVLDQADAFPVGSVRRFDEANLPEAGYRNPAPFYLVHVPEGFFALSWEHDLQGGYKDCDVRYEPASREFSCANGARWDLSGSVIAKPKPKLPDDRLGVKMVRISLDDHVLVSPNVTMSTTSLDLKITQ